MFRNKRQLLWAGILLCLACSVKAQDKTDKEKSGGSNRATAYFADAANFQNNGAFPLAVEEWKKLLKEFPKDPLASKAWHYLGVSYMQLEQPNVEEAIKAFTESLKDEKLDIREDTLIQIAWAMITQARTAKPGSPEQMQQLEGVRNRLTEFRKKYPEGANTDQALFYLGEVEYMLGKRDKAIEQYQALLKSKSLGKSALRPDAQYALGVAYEESQQIPQAMEVYREFVQENPKHRLTSEVQIRFGDLLISQKQFDEGIKALSPMAADNENPSADFALSRIGYAYSQQNKPEQAVQTYDELVKRFPESKYATAASLSAGQALFMSNRWDDAIQRLGKMIEQKDARAAEAVHWTAMALMRKKMPDEAIRLVEPALAWSKDFPAHLSLQMDYADALYEKPDQVEKARLAYELIAKEHADSPLGPRAMYNAAFASLQTQKLTEARQWSETFLNKYPQDPLRNDVAYVAAETLLQQGEHAAAAAAYTKLIQADANNPARGMWVLRMGLANYLAGKYPVVIESLSKELANLKEPRQQAEAHFILGASQLYQDNLDGAIEQFQASRKASDNWAQADENINMLADAFQRKKDNNSAKQVLNELLAKYPNSRIRPQVEFRLGQIAASAGEFDEAIKRYQTILSSEQAKPMHGFAKYGTAWCLMQQEKYEPALQQLDGVLQAVQTGSSVSNEARLAKGVCLRKLGKPQEATALLEEYLNAKPTGAALGNALYELGMTYVDLKEMDKAAGVFDRIVNEVPQYPSLDKVIYELAWIAEEKSDKAKAVGYFTKLTNDFPNSEFVPESLYQVAQKQYEEGKYPEAVGTYSQVLEKTKVTSLREKATYKLAWSFFQQKEYDKAAKLFQAQVQEAPKGSLLVDGLFMQAECKFKQDKFQDALPMYSAAKETLAAGGETAASDQVKTLVYLHGGQCLRELKQWPECEKWLREILDRFPDSPYLATVIYELGYCMQQQNSLEEALKLYGKVAEDYRNEVAARARFMMGEVYFSQRDFAKAIQEFQRVMFGFGGDKAPPEIGNWQAKSAFEAARCSEVLINNLKGDGRVKVINAAKDYYQFVVDKHAKHELAAQAQARLGELSKLR